MAGSLKDSNPNTRVLNLSDKEIPAPINWVSYCVDGVQVDWKNIVEHFHIYTHNKNAITTDARCCWVDAVSANS